MINNTYNIEIVELETDRAKLIKEKLKNNGGYCPCKTAKSNNTKCMCDEFKFVISNMKKSNIDNLVSYCYCGLYAAICKRH